MRMRPRQLERYIQYNDLMIDRQTDRQNDGWMNMCQLWHFICTLRPGYNICGAE